MWISSHVPFQALGVMVRLKVRVRGPSPDPGVSNRSYDTMSCFRGLCVTAPDAQMGRSVN